MTAAVTAALQALRPAGCLINNNLIECSNIFKNDLIYWKIPSNGLEKNLNRVLDNILSVLFVNHSQFDSCAEYLFIYS